MLIYGELAYGRILQLNTMSNLLINNAHLIIIAVGMTFVILTGGIDLSVGSVIALSSVAGVMLADTGLNAWLVIAAMILIGTVHRRHLRGAHPVLRRAAVHRHPRDDVPGPRARVDAQHPAATARRRLRHPRARQPIKLIDGPKVNDLVITVGVIIAFLVVVAAIFVLHRTRTGRTVYAIGGSENSAQLMGLAVHRTKMLVYIISGTLAGVAAVVYTSRLGIGQNITGIGWELDAIAATVIGGTLLTGGAGYVAGSVVGALMLGLMNVLVTRDGGIKPEMVTIITGGILLVFVVLQRAVTARQRE